MISDRYSIRKARPGDEEQLAAVHIRCWQEAYRGILPQTFLDSLSNEQDQRYRMWINILSNPQRWAWVAEFENNIIGFSLFGPPRDPNRENFIELGAIYLLQKHQGKKIGFSLLRTGFEAMKNLGYERAYCWTLEQNPTRRFYEKTGATFSGQTKQDQLGGLFFKELAYDWPSLVLAEK